MNYTVIVAEDEELLLHNLVHKVESVDHSFEVIGKAQTGIQAYELVKKNNPDLLITDIRMPIMDGISLIRKIKEEFPLMDFIITSGYSDFEYTKNAIHLQVCEYLLKPVDPEELTLALLKIKLKHEIELESMEDIFHPTMAQKTPTQIADTLRDYLVKKYNTEINFNDIAQNMNYSSSYLTKIFYKKYNCSPSKYLINLRIQKAKQILLRNPELTIRQIGESVGYCDQGYFSRIFKKQTGISPLEYREKQII